MKATPFLHPSAARAGALLLVVSVVGCSSTSEPSPQGSGGNANGGSANSGGTSTGSGGATSGGVTTGGAANGGHDSSGGSANGGTSSNSGGASGGSASGGRSASGGSTSGGSTSGGSASGGNSTSGGAASGGSVASGGSSSGGGSTSSSGGVGGQPGGAGCPSGVTWCSGFEDSGLPQGAVYKLNGDPATPWTHDFEIDTTQHKSGKSSLRVKSASEAGGAYKMLAVPSGGSAFWVRFYIRSDADLGASAHNVYAQASGSDEPNDASSVEFAEDVGLAFNSHDDVRWPDGYGRTTSGGTKPYTLPKDTWHCIEVSFDGQGKQQKLFINGMQQIDATMFPKSAYTFKNFKFGYNSLNGTQRKVWYDDVAVGPSRINCQ
ncbi:MAG TPA: hypothetical protein VFQ35_28580 [Polyangiaceae bacterium]|nr:hypothetical protein [Polyangiaceae bacterium]